MVVRVIDERGTDQARRVVPPATATRRLRISAFPPGAYRIIARPETAFLPRPVTTVSLVWDDAALTVKRTLGSDFYHRARRVAHRS